MTTTTMEATATATMKTTQLDRLEVRELVLVDAEGRPRLRAALEEVEDSIEVALLDAAGGTRLALYVAKDGRASVNLFDHTGAALAVLGVDEGPSLSLSHREDGEPVEEERVCIAVDVDGQPVVRVGGK